jgi:two-component system, OmpR family, response regulator
MKEVKTIFIVDDDPAQSMMLQDYLSKYSSFKTHVFNSGEEAIKNLHMKPQVVFLDYNFDKVGVLAMNGIDILKEIKRETPETEVVMVSGQDKIEVAVNSMKYGAFDYVVKGESAFYRAENAIFNIIRRLKLQGQASLYKKLAYFFALAFVVMVIVIFILYRSGKITNNPGWM